MSREGLKREIERLSQLQYDALRNSIFGGMTSAEAAEYDDRRTEITRLVTQLEALTKAL